MHTWFGKKDLVINHNGDYSGDWIMHFKSDPDFSLRVPSSDMLEFFADYIRDKRISAIEDKSTEQILEDL